MDSSFETLNLFTHFTNSVQTISSFPTKPGRTIYQEIFRPSAQCSMAKLRSRRYPDPLFCKSFNCFFCSAVSSRVTIFIISPRLLGLTKVIYTTFTICHIYLMINLEETKMPKSSVWRIIQSAKSRNFWLCPKRRLTFELNLTFQKRMIYYADVFKCIS